MDKNHESYCIRHNILNQEAFILKQVSKTIRNIFKWLKCQFFWSTVYGLFATPLNIWLSFTWYRSSFHHL